MSKSKSSRQRARNQRRQRIRTVETVEDVLVSKQQLIEQSKLTIYDWYELEMLVTDLLKPRPEKEAEEVSGAAV